MKAVVAILLLCCTLLCGLSRAAGPALPQRDLTVELRQVEQGREDDRAGGGAHYGAGSAAASAWEPQMVQVRNGEKALLRMEDAIPMQWTQSVSQQNPLPANSNGSTAASSNANAVSSVNNALVWFDAGQSLSVRPRWPGGKQPAVVELEVQCAATEARPGAELPRQTRNTASTTVTLPLGEWLTVAASGAAPKAGVYSSEAGVQVRRLLQLRVLAP
jgi:hypothetical protein